MATYLVTGGAGFIGSNIAEALVKRGDRVRVFDNLSTGHTGNMSSFASDCEFVEGDLRDADAVSKAIKGVDFVIHQAALASVPRSVEDPVSSNEVNVSGTVNVLVAALKHDVSRVVYASSSSIYGDSEELPKVETMVPNPKSQYAVSKLAGEHYMVAFSAVHGLPTVSLRYFNVFGPRQDPTSDYAAVIPIFTRKLLEGTGATIYGDGEQSRDFTYIENVVTGNLLACDSNLDGGRVFNCACGDRFTLNELYDRIRDHLGVDYEAKYEAPRVGDVKHSMAGIDRIQKELGYKPTVSFDDGLKRTVDWYQSTGLKTS